MISQFFILSPRGDTIILSDFRYDVPKTCNELFFRQVKFYQGKQQEAPPIFILDGINYIYLKKQGLYFVSVTLSNVSPSLILELMVFKDYLGILNEESLRKNFVLIYELINEMIDFGYIQHTSTEHLRSYVFNECIPVSEKSLLENIKIPELYPKTTPSSAVDKPLSLISKQKNQTNEVFVDVFERISCTFNSNGYILNSDIDGTIQMKSYLSGHPDLKLALNEDLTIGSQGYRYQLGEQCILDDCNFHESVNLDDFENSRILNINPPDGEFSIMNYRIKSEFHPPFTIFPFFELVNPYKVEMIIKIRAEIPKDIYAGNVIVQFPVPRCTSNVNCQLDMGVVGQNVEHLVNDKCVVWKIKKLPGKTENTLRTKITLNSSHTSAIRKEIGPISMSFEIPMYNVSNLKIRYLRILENSKSYNPFRWVRYVTKSNSYICRL